MNAPILPREPSILIVDDERSGLIPLRLLMLDHGLPVVEARSAHHAIQELEQGAITVVVTDWLMPVRDGISLLDEVADRWPQVERILYTGHLDADLVLDAYGSRHRAVSKSAPMFLLTLVRRMHRAVLTRRAEAP